MFGLGKKKKIDKGAWAEAIYGKKLKNPEKESEAQLSVLTTGLLMQSHRIICAIVGIGGVAIAFEEGFSRDTVVSIFLLLIVIVDLIFKTNISKFFAIFLMLPLIFVGWIFKGILGFFNRGKGKSKPYTLEEMLFYDELFDDKF